MIGTDRTTAFCVKCKGEGELTTQCSACKVRGLLLLFPCRRRQQRVHAMHATILKEFPTPNTLWKLSLQGAGILQPERVAKMNSIRRAVQKIGSMLPGGEPVSQDQLWMKTNRCRRCHGSGVVRCTCTACGGSGRRATP